MSDCKWCWALLVRQPHGAWKPARALQHAKIVDRRPSNGAAHAGASGTERAGDHFHVIGFDRVRLDGPVLRQNAHAIVYQVLDDVLHGNAVRPGARGALFSVVDELRARDGMADDARWAEKVSLGIHQLECALHNGNPDELVHVRRELTALAGERMNSRPQNHH
jgi:hypothetical protein